MVGGLGLSARPAVAAVLAAAALSLGPAGQAAWLQAGYDAARTGFVRDEGPSTDDLAWTVTLPGSKARWMGPLIQDGSVFVLTSNIGVGPSLRSSGLFEVPLATGQARQLIALGGPANSFASDGDRFYLATEDGLGAYARDGSGPLWTTSFPTLVRREVWTRCPPVAVRDGTVYVACVRSGETLPQPSPVEVANRVLFAAAYDAVNGAERWRWVKNVTAEAHPHGQRLVEAPTEVPWSASFQTGILGLSVVGPSVVVTTFNLVGRAGPLDFAAWALREKDGAFLWSLNTTVQTELYADPYTRRPLEGFPHVSAFATGTEQVVYLKLGDLLAVNPTNGRELWREPIGREDARTGDGGGSFALAADALYVPTLHALYRIHPQTRERAWSVLLPPDSAEYWGRESLVVANGTLFARAVTNESPPTTALYAFDADRGTQRWQRTFRGIAFDDDALDFQFAVAEGVMAVAGIDGTVTVLGRTGASLQPDARPSTTRPAPGEEVRIDLGSTGPGIHGPATGYAVDWGDGSRSDWQSSPVLTHAYALAGEYQARVRMRNDAGQSASEVVVMRVGAAQSELSALPVVLHGPTASSRALPTDPFWLLAPLGAVVAGAALSMRRRGQRRRRGGQVALAAGGLFLGRYRVRRALGAGGSGAAWLCRDERTSRDVVLKRVRAPGAESLRAVLREAEALSGLRHPNVVKLHRVEKVGEEALLVMEYVEGGSLADRLRHGPLDAAEFQRTVRGTLDALAAVHAAGMVHRDVKPSNILRTCEGLPKLADFGVAHLPGFETTMGGPIGAAVGTVRFMSPEQARGKRAGPQSDLFSAAATFYEAYTGEPYLAPEDGESAMEVQLRAAKAAPFRRPLQGGRALRAWFARALEPAAEARFPSAQEMRRAFDLAVAQP